MKNKLLHILVFFMAFSALAQERTTILGRVVANDNGVGGVFVINKTAATEVKTDPKGFFDLTAKAGDHIIIYNPQIIVREFTLTEDSFKTIPYLITVNYNAYQLEEIVINKYDHINSESLGLVPKGQLRRTVAERRLYTASAMTIGTVIGIDPIINAISGRTRMLKRAYETEKQEMTINNVTGLYTDEEMVANYHLTKEQVAGFRYFLAEDQDFTAALKSNNKTFIDFLMMELAQKYLKLQADDK